jgi:hypothetical protein
MYPPGGAQLVAEILGQRGEHAALEVGGLSVGKPEQLAVVPGLGAERIQDLEWQQRARG